MKKFFISFFALALTLTVQAQSSLGYQLTHQLKVYNMHKAKAAKGLCVAPKAKKITVIGTLKEGAECPTAELDTLGVKVKRQMLGMVVMEVSIDRLEALGKVSAFQVINANGKHKVKNHQSRIMDHVVDVQDPNNLPAGLKQIYTGKGVIVGVIDNGIDFNHRNFKDDNGVSRVKRVWRQREDENGEIAIDEYNTPEAIDTLTTDDYAESHGTHTAGTAAGSYSGSYFYEDGTSISGQQGVAYESDLLLASGLSDESVLNALDKMIKYAEEEKKPLAINMSFGGNNAWMDGKNTNTTALKNASQGGNAPGILMCVASGNEGDGNITFYKEMKADDELATALVFADEPDDSYEMTIVSEDETPFDVTLTGYDQDGEVVSTYTLDQNAGDLFSTLSYTRDYAKDHDGRFYINITGESEDFEKEDDVQTYILEISATSPCKVRFCSSNIACSNKFGSEVSDELYLPENNNSLNDMIQNKYAFAVGAYASTLNAKKYDGTYEKNDSPAVGSITPFSSWVSVAYNNSDSIGVDFLAPGSYVLSSINHYDTNTDEFLCAMADENTLLGYMEGTSMATPNAIGIMALWLQACPTLTITQVRQIIKETADNDEYTTGDNAPRAGYGKINCLTGLQEILDNYVDGISTVSNATSTTTSAQKLLQDGKFVIIKDGIKYNAVGQRVF